MTVETKTDLSRETGVHDWTRQSSRHGEKAPQRANAGEAPDDDIIFASISAPPIWPRVFPGI